MSGSAPERHGIWNRRHVAACAECREKFNGRVRRRRRYVLTLPADQGLHSPWNQGHRGVCGQCRGEYNAYERRRRPATGRYSFPWESGTPDRYAARRDWLLDVDAAGARRRAGISQQTVARALGVSQAAVCMWETGRRVPYGARGTAYCRVVAGLLRHLAAAEAGGMAEAA
jgi:DNA-binding XRE family transcriptional regulator